MVRWADLPLDPSPQTLRQFAALCFFIFIGLTVWHGVHDGGTTRATVFGVLTMVVGVPGLLAPRLLRPVFIAATVLTFPIGWVVSRVLMALVFFGMFAPLAVVFRLMHRDLLQRRQRSARPSYWIPLPKPDVRRYLKQF